MRRTATRTSNICVFEIKDSRFGRFAQELFSFLHFAATLIQSMMWIDRFFFFNFFSVRALSSFSQTMGKRSERQFCTWRICPEMDAITKITNICCFRYDCYFLCLCYIREAPFPALFRLNDLLFAIIKIIESRGSKETDFECKKNTENKNDSEKKKQNKHLFCLRLRRFLDAIRLLSTCLTPKFCVSHSHRHGTTISLGTKSLFNYESIYFSGLKPSRKNISATDVPDRCDVKFARLDCNQNAPGLDYNKHCDVKESHYSDKCWVSPWCLDIFVKILQGLTGQIFGRRNQKIY